MSTELIKELREKTGAGMLDCKKALAESNGDIQTAIDWLREKGISKAAKKSERIAAEGTAMIMTEENKAIIIEVNSETDFVAKNQEFVDLVSQIAEAILNKPVASVEEALNLETEAGTIDELIVAKTAKIGEKLNLRRFQIVEKEANQFFGSYLHMGGKIAVLTVITNGSEEIAKNIAMHTAAMRPSYICRTEVKETEINKEKEILKEQAISEGKPAEIAEKMVDGRLQKYFKEICLEEQPYVKDPDITVKDYAKQNGVTIDKMIRFEVGEGMEKREENFAEEVMGQIKKD